MSAPARYVPVAAAAAILLTGCSGGSSDTAAATPAASKASAARTPAATPTTGAASAPETAASSAAADGRRGNRPIAEYPDACKLLTRADVRSVYPKASVSPGLPGRGTVGNTKIPQPISCEYDVPVGTEVAMVTLRIGTLVYDARRSFGIGSTIDSPHLTKLPGIGDAAYDPGRVIATTEVLQGSIESTIEISDGHRRRSQPQTEALAKRVAANIKGGAGGSAGLASGG